MWLSVGAAGCMGLIALYQLGVIGHLPEPRVPGVPLGADEVDGSEEAYSILGVPDGVWGVLSYLGTAGLAAAGWRRALGVKVALDALNVVRMVRAQWEHFGKFCFWCLCAAGATTVSVPLAVAGWGRGAGEITASELAGYTGRAKMGFTSDRMRSVCHG